VKAMVDGRQVEVTVDKFVVDPTEDVVFAPSIGGESMSGHVIGHYVQCVANDQYGIRDVLGPGMVAIDVGASVGMFVLAATKLGASVVSFEPDAVDRLALEALAKSLDDVEVVIRPEAVSDEDGEIEMFFTPVSGGSKPAPSGSDRLNTFGLAAAGAQTTTAPCRSIDSVVREMGIERVHLIKVDTEGWEKRILVGAKETLRRDTPLLRVACYHRPEDPEVLPELVRQLAPAYGPAEIPPLKTPDCEYSIWMGPRKETP